MSIVFLESFDNWQTLGTGELGKWQTDNNGSLLTIQAGQGRNGTAALRAFPNGSILNGPGFYLQRPFTTTTRLIMGIAIKITAFEFTNTYFPFQWLDSATPQVWLGINPDGKILLGTGQTNSGVVLATSTSSVITASGVYYYLELDVTFNSATGAFTLRSNGVQVFTASNQNTAPSGNNRVSTLRLGGLSNITPNSQITTSFFDDIYVIDPTVGAQNNAFLGDTRVFAAFPTSDGTPLNFTPSPAGAHYLNVNQIEQDGDATYNFDATAADIDVYGHTATPANTGTIFGVQLCQVSRKDSAAARSTANYLKSAASNTTGATQALSQSYAWYLDIVELDPATGVAFTKTGFDNTQIGVKVAA